jgi:hypothetical protein
MQYFSLYTRLQLTEKHYSAFMSISLIGLFAVTPKVL